MRRRPLPPLLAALVLLASAAPASADFIYVALGDSSAFGETNRTRNPSDGDRGYVAPFADALAARNGGVRPTVWNLAIDGETSSSFSAGTGRVSDDGQGFNTNYDGKPVPYTQSQRLADLFPTANEGVKAVTVQLGANNLDAVASQPDFMTVSAAERQSRIEAALKQFQADYVSILGDVKAKFPSADMYALGYHNPYNGDPDHPFYPIADAAVRGLNQAIWGLADATGARYVDVYGAVHPNEGKLTLIDTWKTDERNYVHLNDDGYAAAAGALIAAAGEPIETVDPGTPGTPEPATLVLAVVGLTAVGVRRVRRKRQAA